MTLQFGGYPGRYQAAPGPQYEPELTSFQVLSSDQQAAAAKQLAAAMPKDVVAHRFGDVVFTYHGIDPAKGDPGLWVAVESPLGAATSPTIGVVNLDGTTRRIPRAAFGAQLRRQNELRAPLPPLPDPATVIPGVPATATPALQPEK
jgi:hypothetical protein